MERFVCLGSLNVDIGFQVERMPAEHEKLRCREAHIAQGGSAANTAHWLSRLGAAVTMLGCTGRDALGESAIDALVRVGVDASGVQRTERAATGVAVVFANPGSKRMVTSGGANAFLDPEAIPHGLFGPRTHLHVATPLAAIALPVLRAARAAGASTSCDLDELPSDEALPLVDICFVNHSDLARALGPLSAQAARGRLLDGRVDHGMVLVVTRGADGAVAAGPTGEWQVAADAVDVVDRTGGGDAFDAGVLFARSRDGDWPAALIAGLRLAARVIAQPGARPEALEVGGLLGT